MFNLRGITGLNRSIGPLVKLASGEVFGVERTAVHHDDIHRHALKCAEGVQRSLNRPARVLDVGGARGELAFDFAAEYGCAVTVIDQGDFQGAIDGRNKNLYAAIPPIKFVRANVKQFDFASLGETFDIILCSRVLHFLNPPEGEDLLRRMQTAMHEDTRAFFFLVGVAEQENLPGFLKNRPWEKRYYTPGRFSLQRILSGTNVPMMNFYDNELQGLFKAAGVEISEFSVNPWKGGACSIVAKRSQPALT